MADMLLEVDSLEAGYGEVQVLWGLSLKARRLKRDIAKVSAAQPQAAAS